MPERLVLDTNVIIVNGAAELAKRGILSAVVLQEIVAGAADPHEVRRWGRLGQSLRSQGRLLVPNGEDWYEAGKVLNSLFRGLRSRRERHGSAISKEEQRRLVRDVLIARSAKRANASVVTYNRRDFEKIRRFCAVRIVDPPDMLQF